MQTAELGRREGSSGPALLAAARLPSTAELARRWAWPALAVVLCGGLALRLWGIRQGLPYAFNADEADRKATLEDIPEKAFPEPGPLPKIPDATDDAVIELPPDDLPTGEGVPVPK